MDPILVRTVSPLPELPGDLLQKQKSLTEQRDPKPAETIIVRPPTTPRDESRIRLSSKRRENAAVHKRSSTLLLSSDPNSVLTRYYPPLESLTDPLEIVERLKREPELGFLYLSPINDFKSIRYNPYNLRSVLIAVLDAFLALLIPLKLQVKFYTLSYFAHDGLHAGL